MILKLLLDKDHSLLYERTALQEVEGFLINAKKTLTSDELQELKQFIQEASEQNNDRKSISNKEKKRLLKLIEGKEKPIGHTLYEIKSGRITPSMDEASFAALNNKEIITRLATKREWYEA